MHVRSRVEESFEEGGSSLRRRELMEFCQIKEKKRGVNDRTGAQISQLTSARVDGRKGDPLCIPGGLSYKSLGQSWRGSVMARTPMDESLAARHASSATLAACCIAGRRSRGGTPSLGDATSAKAYSIHE